MYPKINDFLNPPPVPTPEPEVRITSQTYTKSNISVRTSREFWYDGKSYPRVVVENNNYSKPIRTIFYKHELKTLLDILKEIPEFKDLFDA